MNRAERRRIERALGHKTTKMKRQRPPAREVQEAIRDQVAARIARQDEILGRNSDPRKLLVPKPPEPPKELWTPS